MRPTGQDKGLSFKDVIGIFWEWRQASISVEVCFFGKAESSDTVRVSIDGLVSLVDPQGIITVSGDGREIELDLRGCEFQHAREMAARQDVFDPLDPNSILQVKFPNEEVCVVFPYRRVAPAAIAHRREESGLEWLQSKLGNTAVVAMSGTTDSSGLGDGRERSRKQKTSHSGPPIFPLGAFLVVFLVAAFALTPSNVPKLLGEMGVRRSSMNHNPDAEVWALRQEGNYYCSGSMLAGRKPGQLMKQSEALTLGYQPALGHYCGSDQEGAGAQDGRFSSYIWQLSRSGGRIISKLLTLTHSLLSGSYERSAAVKPAAALPPAPRRASATHALEGSPVAASSAATAPAAGKAVSAAGWSATPR